MIRMKPIRIREFACLINNIRRTNAVCYKKKKLLISCPIRHPVLKTRNDVTAKRWPTLLHNRTANRRFRRQTSSKKNVANICGPLFSGSFVPRVGSRAHELSIYYPATLLLNAAQLFHVSPAVLLRAYLPENEKLSYVYSCRKIILR